MHKIIFNIFPNELFVDLGIYQYGYEQCQPLQSYGPYVRNHYLFHYVISGTGILSSTNSVGETIDHRVRSGEGFLISPKQTNTYYADKYTPWEYCWIEFDGLRVKEALDIAGLSFDHPIYHSNAKDISLDLMNELLYIVHNPTQSPFNLIGHLYLALDYLTRSSVNRTNIKQGNLADFYVKEAISFVEQNFQNNISVEDISKSCNLNRSYFGKIFRDVMGKSPQEFLINYRMTKAAELLKLTKLPIHDISNVVGYPNQLYFSRAFKNVYGISPRQWRIENRILINS